MAENNYDLIKEWYKFAMTDYITAKHLHDTLYPKPLEIICYHCQQAAEKLLKGFLVSQNIDPPKTHDLLRICELCFEFNGSFVELKKFCQILNPYGVQPRYPNEIEILETDAAKSLESIQATINFFQKQDIAL